MKQIKLEKINCKLHNVKKQIDIIDSEFIPDKIARNI